VRLPRSACLWLERSEILDSLEVGRRLRALIAQQPELATEEMLNCCDHQNGAAPLSYVAMMRLDTSDGGVWRDLPGTGDLTRLLLAAGTPVTGTPVNGDARDDETPLMTAGKRRRRRTGGVLVEAGASLEAGTPVDAENEVWERQSLRLAASNGRVASVRHLFAGGAAPNHRDPEQGLTALQTSARPWLRVDRGG
jgi:hypothetical protein